MFEIAMSRLKNLEMRFNEKTHSFKEALSDKGSDIKERMLERVNAIKEYPLKTHLDEKISAFKETLRDLESDIKMRGVIETLKRVGGDIGFEFKYMLTEEIPEYLVLGGVVVACGGCVACVSGAGAYAFHLIGDFTCKEVVKAGAATAIGGNCTLLVGMVVDN